MNNELERNGGLGVAEGPDGSIRWKKWNPSPKPAHAWEGVPQEDEGNTSAPEGTPPEDETDKDKPLGSEGSEVPPSEATEKALAKPAEEISAKAMEDPTTPLKSEDGWWLGTVLEVSQTACNGAESITQRALDLWDQEYASLAAELGEPDLAATVRAAAKPLPAMGPSGNQDAVDQGDQVAVDQGTRSKPVRSSWSPTDGWWLEKPIAGRVLVSCGVVPRPFATLSANGVSLLSAEGAGIIHLAAATQQAGISCQARSFALPAALDELSAWVEEVPDKTTVLLALVLDLSHEKPEQHASSASEALQAISTAGLGCPAKVAPGSYVAMAAVGKKGTKSWHSTHASPDIALATGLI